MHITKAAKTYHERMFPWHTSELSATDPEFIERFDNFAFDEVIAESKLDDKTRFLAILATLLGCQGIDEFRAIVPAALEMGVTPVEVKETVYQAAAYLGIGRVFPFLKATNEIFTARGIALPLQGQATTTFKTASKGANRRRSTSSARACAGLQAAAPRRRGISISGLWTTASATTIRVRGWICAGAR